MLAAVGRMAAEVDEPETLLVDLYVSWPDRPGDADAMAAAAARDARRPDAAAVGPPGHGHGVHPGRRRRHGDLPAVGGRRSPRTGSSAACTR